MYIIRPIVKFIMLFLFSTLLYEKTIAQKYSIRTNLLNLIARGPSLTTGKYLKNNSEVLLTFSSGHFSPFLFEDYYKYSTVHIECRKNDGYFLWGNFYFGGYSRYINKRIITEGFTAGPNGIFSKAPRNFIGHGISVGLTSGIEWEINKNWLIDYNNLIGAGKYLTQIDYAGHDKISFFPDIRIALQIGYKF